MSFSEILVILLVAVLVIKPEHLPSAAETVGRFIKWFRVTIENIRRDMEEPLQDERKKF